MPTETIELSRFLPAPPLRIYDAWLDAGDHAAMTGGKATVESREVGGRFTAWDGYIDGSHVALEPGARIVQSWRSDDFPAEALDSLLEVLLAPEDEGTRITIRHSDLPEGHGPGLLEGWDEHYLVPMERFFRAEAKAERAARGTKRGAARKKAVTKKAEAPRKAGAKKATAKRAPARRASARKPARRKVKAGPAPRRKVTARRR
jgi:uncharacterized protein YndB with AHSA1/START domain